MTASNHQDANFKTGPWGGGEQSQFAPGVNLLQSDGITPANLASLQHRSIDTDISPIVFGCRAQDTYILGKITLRKRRHNAAGARTIDAQPDGISDR